MAKNPKRPKDTNQLAKLIVDMATGEISDKTQKSDKNPNAVALGSLGGQKGGVSRAKKLSPEKRTEIAKKAAKKRWGNR